MISVTSLYFQNYKNSNEQELLDDLVVESVSIYGIDVYYVARDLNNFDIIYGEDDSSSYSKTWQVAVYLKDVFGYSGDKQLMSKLAGLEIRDQIVLSMPNRSFEKEIQREVGYARPHEGDLIYFPFNQTIFQIKFVNQNEMFFQLGTIHSWELTCELFEYSAEKFDTGIPQIDALQKGSSANLFDWALRADDGTPLTTEAGDYLLTDNYNLAVINIIADNAEINKESDTFLDWTEDDPFNDETDMRV